MIKSIAISLLLAGAAGCAGAQTDNIVGLWERLPVMAGSKVVAVPSLVFTNRKLEAPTVFTGLQDGGKHLRVLCCVEVRNLEPVKTADLLKKYAADPDFVEQVKSIKGLGFVYEAKPVDKREWNDMMKNVMSTSDDPSLATPFSVPVTAAPLGKVPRVDKSFKVGDKAHELKTVYEQGGERVRYTYKVGGETTTFSENAPSAE